MNPLTKIRSDYRRIVAAGSSNPVRVVLFNQGLWAVCVYRLSRWCYERFTFPLLAKPIRFVCQCARKLAEIVTGISLPPDCKIGEGLYVGHFGTIIVSSSAVLGSNCNLSQGVTIGFGGRGQEAGYPVLGDRVFVGANAVIIGPVSIGDDVVVGAGAVVTKTIPSRAVVIGNPAFITSWKGSFDFIKYDGIETDPARNASMALAAQKPEPELPKRSELNRGI